MKLISTVTAALLALVLFSASNKAAEGSQELIFIEGVDYFKVAPKKLESSNQLDQLAQVADIELFYWFGCPACFRAEEAIKQWAESRPELNLVYTPLVAHLSWREQAYLQPLREQLAFYTDLPPRSVIYETCLEDCTVFNSYEAGRSWLLAATSLDELPQIDEAKIWQAEKDYRKRADSFSISQVPTIIIKESYRVDANSAKSLERMVAIIDFLINTPGI